jgi:hypothetical protein
MESFRGVSHVVCKDPTPSVLSRSFVMILLTAVEKLPRNRYPIFGFGRCRFFADRRGVTMGKGSLESKPVERLQISKNWSARPPCPQFEVGKSIHPLDDHLRRTVTPREESESLRFCNRTFLSVNENLRTDGTRDNVHW